MSSPATNYPALAQLLGCYFHQDWCDEYADTDAAVLAFAHGEGPIAAAAVVAEIDRLEHDVQFGSDPRALLDALGCGSECSYRGQTPFEWLTEVRDRLRRPPADG